MHVVFVAPFFMQATLRFVFGAADLPGVRLSVVSQDPLGKLPPSLRGKLVGHQQVADCLNPAHIAIAIEKLATHLGKPILAPTDVPGAAHVFMCLPHGMARNVDRRLSRADTSWRAALPPLSA